MKISKIILLITLIITSIIILSKNINYKEDRVNWIIDAAELATIAVE